MKLGVVLAVALLSVGTIRTEESRPNTDAIISVSTPSGFGHACPVSATSALTARHVVDPTGHLNYAAPVIWEDAAGKRGVAKVSHVDNGRDIAGLVGEFPAFFAIATEIPKAGDELTIVGYDYRKIGNAFKRRVWTVRMIGTTAGMLVYDRSPEPGSSGSCVLNAAGEVVGINVWGFPFGRDMAGIAVNVVEG